MNKTHSILAIIVIATVIGMSTMAYSYSQFQEAEAQQPSNAFINNVIFSPGNTDPVNIHIGGTSILTPIANANGQAPSFQVPAGTVDITITPPSGFTVIQVGCGVQDSSGAFTEIGTWDGSNTVNAVPLVAANFQKCVWLLHQDDTLEENIAEIEKQVQQSISSKQQLESEITQIQTQIASLVSQEASKEAERLSVQQQIDDLNTRLVDLINLLGGL